jgi:hypothetical protein
MNKIIGFTITKEKIDHSYIDVLIANNWCNYIPGLMFVED